MLELLLIFSLLKKKKSVDSFPRLAANFDTLSLLFIVSCIPICHVCRELWKLIRSHQVSGNLAAPPAAATPAAAFGQVLPSGHTAPSLFTLYLSIYLSMLSLLPLYVCLFVFFLPFLSLSFNVIMLSFYHCMCCGIFFSFSLFILHTLSFYGKLHLFLYNMHFRLYIYIYIVLGKGKQ